MARFITFCPEHGSCTGNVTDDQLLHLIHDGPLNRSPFTKADRTEFKTLKCSACKGPISVTFEADGARRY